MKLPEIRVLISGFGGLSNAEPGTAVARSLKLGWKGKITIDAMGYDPWITGALSPGLIDHIHIIPPLVEGDGAMLERIQEIHEKRKINILIATLDLEIPVFSRLSPYLHRLGIKTLLPLPEACMAISKSALSSFCLYHAIKTPQAINVPDIHNVPYYANQLGYPLFVKGSVAGAYEATNDVEALFFAKKLNEKWGGGAILQEKIEGDEYDAALIARRNGSCLGYVACRKLGRNKLGKGIVGAVIDNPKFKQSCLNILRSLNWQGALELEFIFDQSTKEYLILEINPRFPAWILLSCFAGNNLPVLMVKEILGLKPKSRYCCQNGTSFCRDIEETTTRYQHIEELHRKGTVATVPPLKTRQKHSKLALKVATTGINAFDEVMPGAGIARALQLSPEVSGIYGLAYGPYDTGIYRKDLINGAFLIPEKSTQEEFIAVITKIKHKTDIDAIIPCIDSEIPLWIDSDEILKSLGIATLLPSRQAFDRAVNLKLPIHKFNNHSNLLYEPLSFNATSPSGITRAANNLGFPLVIKASLPYKKAPIVLYSKSQIISTWGLLKSSA